MFRFILDLESHLPLLLEPTPLLDVGQLLVGGLPLLEPLDGRRLLAGVEAVELLQDGLALTLTDLLVLLWRSLSTL